jgi:hypothetical protein
LDLASPHTEHHAAESAPPPKPERNEAPAGDSGHGDSKPFTVWSGGPTPSSGSWGPGGTRREE